MKTILTILAVLLVIAALIITGLQLFLTRGLTSALNQGVFPAVKSMYGLQMEIENASVNLFKGNAELSGFAVSNLKGYQEPHLLTFDKCRLDLDLTSLLNRKPVIIKNVEATGAVLVIERNKQKKYNVKELADALKPVESVEKPDTPPAKPAPAPDTEPSKPEPVPVHIQHINVDAIVNYVDSGRKRNYALNLVLTATDLFTAPENSHPNSLITLRGSLKDDEGACATDLTAMIEPLTDPANPTFSASGSILDIDAVFIQELLDKNDMKSGPFSIRPSITCKKGELAGSFIDLSLTDLNIYGASIGKITVPLPVTGTFQKPSIDWTASFSSLLSKQTLNIGKALGLKELKKELGLGADATPKQTLMGQLTNRVSEVEKSPALQNLIEQVVPGSAPAGQTVTNKPIKATVGDALIEQLDNVKELEGNDAVKNVLRELFK